MKVCFNRELIEDIKKRSDILAITLVKYNGPVKITSRGDFRIRCVFHEDHTPSLILYPKDNKFRCLSTKCQKCGDVIDLTKKMYNLNFIEAVQNLAYAFYVTVPKVEKEKVDYEIIKKIRRAKHSKQYEELKEKSYQKVMKK